MNEGHPPQVSGRWRLWRRRALRVFGALVVLALLFLVLTPIGRYLMRAGWEEAKILKRRRPIAEMVRDDSLPLLVRRKLQIVLDARAYARDSLGLDAKESFTTYTQLRRDTLVLVLSGVYPDQLKQKTWWFPIVGSVPYKGYFNPTQAKRAAEDLKKEGFDAYLRPASAFSTLGWFNDPLVSTTLRADSIDLVNTVIHELTHNTYYAAGGATFNESFANFVGSRGAAAFFRSRGSLQAADEAEARWYDERLMGAFWGQLYKTVDSAFKAHPGDSNRVRRIAVRDTIYSAARDRLIHELGPRFRVIGPHVLERIRIDNAAVMARRVYLTDVDLFDAIWQADKRDTRRTIAHVIQIARDDVARKPFDALRRAIQSGSAPRAPTR